jgi:hypothetical protein
MYLNTTQNIVFTIIFVLFKNKLIQENIAPHHSMRLMSAVPSFHAVNLLLSSARRIN